MNDAGRKRYRLLNSSNPISSKSYLPSEIDTRAQRFSLLRLFRRVSGSGAVVFDHQTQIVNVIPQSHKYLTKNFDDFSRTRNSFFNFNSISYDNDKLLYDLVLTEAYNKHGVSMTYYVVSYDTDYNEIFKEDNNRKFTKCFDIMGYYQLPREDEMFSQFGIDGLDVFQIFVSKKHFKTASTRLGYYNEEYTPKPGDLIRPLYNEFFYEIVTVKQEIEMFLQGKHTWELTVQKYKINNIN